MISDRISTLHLANTGRLKTQKPFVQEAGADLICRKQRLTQMGCSAESQNGAVTTDLVSPAVKTDAVESDQAKTQGSSCNSFFSLLQTRLHPARQMAPLWLFLVFLIRR